MKNITNILLAAIIAVMPLAAKGEIQTKSFDGSWYSIDTENKTATLTSGKDAQYVNIPEKITVDDVEYTVTTIGGGAFGRGYTLGQTLVIPATVKKIEAGDYYKTFSHYMTTLYLLTPDAEIASNAFNNRSDDLVVNTVPGHKYTNESFSYSSWNTVPNPTIKVGTYWFDEDGMIHMTEETDVKDDVEFTDDKNFDNNAEYITTKATYTRKSVTAGNWCSLCLPFDCEVPEGVSVYAFVEMNSDAVVFSEVEKITAGVPYVFKSAAGGDVTFSAENALIKTRADLGKVSNVTNGNNVFIGALQGYSFIDSPESREKYPNVWSTGNTYYGIEKESNTFKKLKTFANNTDLKSTCSPYHAFIQVKKNSSSAPALKVIGGGGDDGTTSIGGMKTEEVKTDAIYNLNGQRMAAPRKGINIINGKKVIIK